MGAQIETTDGHLPLTVTGARAARDRLRAAGRERAGEVGDAARRARRGRPHDRDRARADARPHRADAARGRRAASARGRARSASTGAERLRLDAVDVPGDFSSAAPFIVAATLVPESRMTIHDVGLNPRRTGLLDVLDRMGARVGILTRRRLGQEPVGDLEVRAGELTATTIGTERGAAADRRAAALRAARGARARHEPRLRRRGAAAQGVRPDRGARRRAARARRARARRTTTASRSPACRRGRAAAEVDARGDHRIAMLGAVAGALRPAKASRSRAPTASEISFPGFYDLLDQ